MRILASAPDIDDESIGLHAHQAIEARLKAVLAAKNVRFKPKQSLVSLLELLADAGIEAPPGKDRMDGLAIFAGPLRYEECSDAEPLDREAIVTLVDEVGDWAARLI